jgi:2-oxoglutarate dehydrogenase E2 component (dihydrolipoamide succinyltransferase)
VASGKWQKPFTNLQPATPNCNLPRPQNEESMSIEIKVPQMGESVVEATVGEWLKKEGDTVNLGDVLVELETDKVDVEVGAESSGVLGKILVASGEDVQVGDVLGVIEPNGSAAPSEAKAEPEKAAETAR